MKDVFLHDHPRFLDRINRGVRIREFVNVELPLTLERRADLVVRLENGHVHHVEFQSYNDPDLPYRQGIECFMIAQRYKRDVDQTLIYFGARKMRMASRLNAGAAGVKYRLIDIRNYRASSFLKRGGPADLVLATLAGDGEKNLRRILEKVNALPEAQRRRTLTQIAAMAGLRKLSGTVTMWHSHNGDETYGTASECSRQ